MKKYIIILLSLVGLPIIAQKPVDKRLNGLDTFVARVLKDWKAPGVTIAVVEKNNVVYTGGFGYRDLEKKLPVTESTLFAIGSCTKAFTASLLGMLAKDGLVDYDKPVRNYLPELKFYNEYLNDHVTLRDMMSHRTGLPRHDNSWYGSNASRMELLRRIEFQEPTEELRAKWQYNNFMFLSQGVVIEKLSGKSWEDNMKEKILNPLGMNQTETHISGMESAQDKSLAYTLIKDSFALLIPYRNIDAIGPAGSINSSAKDMAKWLITWINGGKYMGKEIIPADHVKQAMSIQMAQGSVPNTAENPDVQGFGYGLAWGISSYRSHYRVEHGGGIDGFISSTGFFPNDSIGIFVASCTGGVTSSIRNYIADRMLGLPYRDWEKVVRDPYVKQRFASMMNPKKIDSSQLILNTHPSHPLTDYVGKYINKGYSPMELKMKGQDLVAESNGMTFTMKHKYYDLFEGKLDGKQYEEDESLDFLFSSAKDGSIHTLSLPLQPGLKDIVFTRDEGFTVKTDDLKKYAGEYTLGPQAVSFVIRGNSLFALLPPQPDYELIPTAKDEFKLKIMEGFKVKFKIDESGKASEASFIQPNGVFTAKRK